MNKTEGSARSLDSLLDFLRNNLESQRRNLEFAEKEYTSCVEKAEAILDEHRQCVQHWQGWYEAALELAEAKANLP